MNFYDELRAVIRTLESSGIDYAVCGGVALAIHGAPRFTRDIDLLVCEEDVDRVLDLVRANGFDVPGGRLRFGAGKAREQIVHRVSKIIDGALLTLDLIVVNPRLSDVWENRQSLKWLDGTIRVVSLEGLTFMKREAARKQDLADIERLETLQESEEHEGDHDDSNER